MTDCQFSLSVKLVLKVSYVYLIIALNYSPSGLWEIGKCVCQLCLWPGFLFFLPVAILSSSFFCYAAENLETLLTNAKKPCVCSSQSPHLLHSATPSIGGWVAISCDSCAFFHFETAVTEWMLLRCCLVTDEPARTQNGKQTCETVDFTNLRS